MKIRILIILLFFYNNSFSQSKGRITYKVSSEQIEYNENDSQSRIMFINMMNKLSKIRDSLLLNLDFKDNESQFYVDEEIDLGLSNEKGYKATIKSFNWYYKNDVSKISIEKINSDGIYLVHSNSKDILWEITKDKKKIGNFICYKATSTVLDYTVTKGVFKKHIEAWFSPDVTVSLGPKNFGGLPGLIMELKDGKLIYYVKSIDLDPDFAIEIKKPDKGKSISQEEYFKMQPKITKENIKEYIGG